MVNKIRDIFINLQNDPILSKIPTIVKDFSEINFIKSIDLDDNSIFENYWYDTYEDKDCNPKNPRDCKHLWIYTDSYETLILYLKQIKGKLNKLNNEQIKKIFKNVNRKQKEEFLNKIKSITPLLSYMKQLIPPDRWNHLNYD